MRAHAVLALQETANKYSRLINHGAFPQSMSDYRHPLGAFHMGSNNSDIHRDRKFQIIS